MTALKKFLAATFLALLICATVEAADKPRVIVMDCRIFEDSFRDNEYDGVIADIAKDFVIRVLINSRHFLVMENDSNWMIAEEYSEIKNSDLPDSAKEVDYFIYGDNFIEVTRKDEKFQSAKCTTILYLWNAKTEQIVTAVKGEGVYKRSEFDADNLKGLDKNTILISSVHNAIKKAASDSVDKLIKKIFES